MNELIISEEAREYITRKGGGSVHLIVYGRSSLCCGKVGFPPPVQLGIPKNGGDYELKKIDEIDFYVPKGGCLPNSMRIGLHRTFGISSLHIEGWKLI